MTGKDRVRSPGEGSPSPPGRGPTNRKQPLSGGRAGDQNAGWVIVSYLVTGMVSYVGLGWLIGHWIDAVTAVTLIGLLVGLALAVALVIFRYGRS